ncbi:MAG: hypothetical protein GY881_10790 [Gammaproteobacteria bacterium]|nr:hypothetical protein [Gammaproteobacteria bacterium]MCP4879564.1 hypothetical protein [Gammaproteobacteria bacterium]MDP6165855.1 PilZ domain-containing protein [Gammaproteobacteria bacterium]
MNNINTNRRQHYRITDLVKVGLHVIAKESEQEVIEDITQGLTHSSLARINSEVEIAIDSVSTQHKDVQAALQALNRKLDLVVGAINLHPSHTLREQTISLGFGGCRLLTDVELGKDQAVDLTIVLADSQRLRLFARVVDVKAQAEQDSGGYEVALQFQAMSKVTAATLEKHIMLFLSQ